MSLSIILPSIKILALNKHDTIRVITTMITEITKLVNGNRIVIPAAIRKSLGLQIGDAVTIVLQDDGEVRLSTQTEAVRQAQTLVRRHVAKDRTLVDELLAERREDSLTGHE